MSGGLLRPPRLIRERPVITIPLPFLRVERHTLGPRVYIAGRRIHEWMLGVTVLCAATALRLAGELRGTALAALLAAGVWLFVKDWQDLRPSSRDTAAWRFGVHRRVASLRAARRGAWVPPLAAASAATIAVVNLISALTPGVGWRGRLLLQLEPVESIPIFHALAVPASVLLLAASVYLGRRRRRACVLAVVVLAVLGALNLLKGLDVEEAGLSWALAVVLAWARGAFHVHHEPLRTTAVIRRLPVAAAAVGLLVLLSVWIAAPASAGAVTVLREAGDLLLWQRGPVRLHDEVGRLPLGVGLLELIGLLAAVYALFRPLAAPRSLPDPALRRTVRRLLQAHGTDTLAYFKLRRDKSYLLSSDGRAFAGYRIGNGVLVVSGDPVGAAEAVPGLVREISAFAELRGLKLAVLGASEALVQVWREAGLRSLYIGDEAIVDTDRFLLEGRPVRKVRQSVTRLVKAGYTTEVVEVAQLDETTLAELRRVSAAWLGAGAERGFCMALDGIGGDDQADTVAVVARDQHGVARGFLHLVPTYGRRAMSLAAMRRERATPNGLTEFLVVRAIDELRVRGIDELSLNFAAFARFMHSPETRSERLLGKFVSLANPYFQIESLYRFNAKFFPRWEPRFLLYEGTLGLPRAGIAALRLEGQLPSLRR